jgi:hypothetical protein
MATEKAPDHAETPPAAAHEGEAATPAAAIPQLCVGPATVVATIHPTVATVVATVVATSPLTTPQYAAAYAPAVQHAVSTPLGGLHFTLACAGSGLTTPRVDAVRSTSLGAPAPASVGSIATIHPTVASIVTTPPTVASIATHATIAGPGPTGGATIGTIATIATVATVGTLATAQ